MNKLDYRTKLLFYYLVYRFIVYNAGAFFPRLKYVSLPLETLHI